MRAVLFDLDDTLFDHQHGTRVALADLRQRHAALQVWSEDELATRHSELLECLHMEVTAGRLDVDTARLQRFGALFEMVGHPLTAATKAAVASEYRETYLASWRLVPGALEAVAALRDHARLGIVTNNVVGEQTRKVRKLGLEPYFDAVVISEAEGVAKPDRRIFAAALSRLGSRAAEATMVGDAWGTDITGAKRAGLRPVWFNPARRPAPAGSEGVAQLDSWTPVSRAVSVVLGSGADGSAPGNSGEE